MATVDATFRDYRKERPVSDEIFEVYRGLYAYDTEELDARVEERETTDDWTREKVSFDAAYGDERVTAHVFLPRKVPPPFQAVVLVPGANAYADETFDSSLLEWYGADFLPKSGGALVYPIYKGTYERRDGFDPQRATPGSRRDRRILWSKDLGRTLDYLETRSDIDSTRVAFFGRSAGVVVAPILLAVEKRLKAALLYSGGYLPRYELPEADPLNFTPRVNVPVLMQNGRYDGLFPLELSQVPMFHHLGTPEPDKKHVVFEAGHSGGPRKEEIRETLDWLDKYLGPVERGSSER